MQVQELLFNIRIDMGRQFLHKSVRKARTYFCTTFLDTIHVNLYEKVIFVFNIRKNTRTADFGVYLMSPYLVTARLSSARKRKDFTLSPEVSAQVPDPTFQLLSQTNLTVDTKSVENILSGSCNNVSAKFSTMSSLEYSFWDG